MHHAEEDIPGLGILQHKCPLPEIIHEEGKKDKKPGTDNRFFADVPHVGIQGLTAGGAEDNLGEDHIRGEAIMTEEVDGIQRINRPNDLRHARHRDQSGNKEGDEVDEHDRTEDAGHAIRPLRLKDKEGQSDKGGDGDQYPGLHPGEDGNQQHPFHRREDTDRRRDHPVAKEERNAENGEEAGKADHSPLLEDFIDDFAQYNLAALTAFIETHGEPGILHGDEDGHGPEDQRKDAVNIDQGRLGEDEDDGEGINRTGADIAKDQTESLDHAAQGRFGCMPRTHTSPFRN